MKSALSIALICLLTIVSVYAQSYDDYQKNIAKNRLLLTFTAGTTAEQKQAIISNCSAVQSFLHVPFPAVTICEVTDKALAEKYFAEQPSISQVSFFMTDHQGHYAGVLDNFFVKLKDDNFKPMLQEKVRQLGLSLPQADAYIPRLYKLTLPTNSKLNTIAVCSLLNTEAWVEYVSPNYLLQPLVTSTDPLYSRQWSLSNEGTIVQGGGTLDADMDADSAWMLTTGSIDIKISIIDSGVDTLHPDLIDNILPGYDALGDSTDGYPTPVEKEDGHGTCCAGIVAAAQNTIGVSGVAPNCKLVPVRAFYYVKPQGSAAVPLSTSEAFANAIGWSWKVAGADILSNSWGLPNNLLAFLPGGVLPVENAIQVAADSGRLGKGAVQFFSSGNENDSTGPIWPAKLARTIAVNASTMCDEHKNPNDCSGESWGGNWGGNLDFSAPGTKVATTDIQGTKGFINGAYYNSFNGTSSACPNAAGVAALVLSVRPDLKSEDVRHVMAITCDKVGGYAYDSSRLSGSWCNELGYGRLNAYQAVQFAQVYTSLQSLKPTNLDFKLYPNPASETITIQTESASGTLQLIGLLGNLVQSVDITTIRTELSLVGIPQGMYVVQWSNNSQSVAKRLVIGR